MSVEVYLYLNLAYILANKMWIWFRMGLSKTATGGVADFTNGLASVTG